MHLYFSINLHTGHMDRDDAPKPSDDSPYTLHSFMLAGLKAYDRHIVPAPLSLRSAALQLNGMRQQESLFEKNPNIR